jgi:16S rRNA (guanine966-N2)-methyltransferase
MPAVTNRKTGPRTGPSHSVRIIGGAWRGRRIPVLAHAELRPTADRIRETLFNWLRADVAGARCLDLFAGSGALGFEALSRGAREAVFVERSAPAAANLRTQLERLGATDRAQVQCRDAEGYLREPGATFDLVFLDPPFGSGALEGALAQLAGGDRLAPGGLVYLEAERSAGVPALPPGWRLLRSKFAGEVGYHLARRER